MSGQSDVLDIIEACEEQGFRVRALQRQGGWQIFPKTSTERIVTIHNGRSQINAAKLLNIRSALRKIGVVFESSNRKPKEPTVAVNERPPLLVGKIVPVLPASPATPPQAKPSIKVAQERLRVAVENLELACLELKEASEAVSAAQQPLIAMGELLNQIRG